MIILPTLRQLRFLVAVVERRHFSTAADDCLVSQSTLSAAIQELESLLGVKLLERTKRVVIPTAIGLDLAARAKKLLRDAEALVEAAQEARDPMAGALNLGIIPTIGPFLAPILMPALHKAFPTLKIYLREEQTAPLLARLDNGRIDAAVIALPFACDEFETFDLGIDKFFVVCPSSHPFAARAFVRGSDLADEELLLLEDGHCMRDHALAACSLDARRAGGFHGTSLHTLVQMVANGLGLTFAPEMALEAGLLRGLDLAAVPLEQGAPARRIALVCRPTSSRKALLRGLGASLREVMAMARAPNFKAPAA